MYRRSVSATVVANRVVLCERAISRLCGALGTCDARFRAYLRWMKCPLHCPVAICFAGPRNACMCRGNSNVLCTLPAAERVLLSTRIVFYVILAQSYTSKPLHLR